MITNSRSQRLALDPRTSLLDVLREHLHLAGTKKGCNQGACGRHLAFPRPCDGPFPKERWASCSSRIADNDADYVTPLDMLAELREDNKQLAAHMRTVQRAWRHSQCKSA